MEQSFGDCFVYLIISMMTSKTFINCFFNVVHVDVGS